MASYNLSRFIIFSLILAALLVPHECYEEAGSSSLIGRKLKVENKEIIISESKINVNLCKRYKNCVQPSGDCYCCLIGPTQCYLTDEECGAYCR
ncbi:hypothetical protein ABFS82_13G112100 [Erythranthe guttata]